MSIVVNLPHFYPRFDLMVHEPDPSCSCEPECEAVPNRWELHFQHWAILDAEIAWSEPHPDEDVRG